MSITPLVSPFNSTTREFFQEFPGSTGLFTFQGEGSGDGGGATSCGSCRAAGNGALVAGHQPGEHGRHADQQGGAG